MMRGHSQYQRSLPNHRFAHPSCAVGPWVDPHLLQGRQRVRGDGSPLERRGARALGSEGETFVLGQGVEYGLGHRAAADVGGTDEEDLLHRSLATLDLLTLAPCPRGQRSLRRGLYAKLPCSRIASAFVDGPPAGPSSGPRGAYALFLSTRSVACECTRAPRSNVETGDNHRRVGQPLCRARLLARSLGRCLAPSPQPISTFELVLRGRSPTRSRPESRVVFSLKQPPPLGEGAAILPEDRPCSGSSGVLI